MKKQTSEKYPVAKKKFGQNFLQVPYYCERIANAVGGAEEDCVLEIGPGLGALSVYLKDRYPQFHLIEMDRDVIPFLTEKLGEGSWTLHQGNALEFDFLSVGTPLHIVGNLPYNIASLLIKKALYCAPAVQSVTFMVQREVAERITASPNSKKMGFLSVFCQFFGEAKLQFHVPNGAFIPKPKIESSVFTIKINPQIESRLPRDHWERFFAMVTRGYQSRRKKLIKSLITNERSRDDVEEIFTQLELDSNARAENLSTDQWVMLYNALELNNS